MLPAAAEITQWYDAAAAVTCYSTCIQYWRHTFFREAWTLWRSVTLICGNLEEHLLTYLLTYLLALFTSIESILETLTNSTMTNVYGNLFQCCATCWLKKNSSSVPIYFFWCSVNSCPLMLYCFLSTVNKQFGSNPSLSVRILYALMRSSHCLLFSSEVLVDLLWTFSRQSMTMLAWHILSEDWQNPCRWSESSHYPLPWIAISPSQKLVQLWMPLPCTKSFSHYTDQISHFWLSGVI